MLIYLFSILLFLGGLYAAYRYWQKRVFQELQEGAEFEYARLQRAEPELIGHLSKDKFSGLYQKTEMPRFPGYALATLSAFLIGTPIFFMILAAGELLMVATGVIPTPGQVVDQLILNDDGSASLVQRIPPVALQYYVRDLGGFYYFFGLLAFWIFTVWFFMRRYHKRRPDFLRDEIIRLR